MSKVKGKKMKPIKAWTVITKDKIQISNTFPSYLEAKWFWEKQPVAEIITVLITPINTK